MAEARHSALTRLRRAGLAACRSGPQDAPAPQLLRSVLRASAGPYRVLIDLRDLDSAPAPARTRAISGGFQLDPAEYGEAFEQELDLRPYFRVENPLVGQRYVLRAVPGTRQRSLILDPGAELVRLDLAGLVEFPPLLHAERTLRCLRGVLPLQGGTDPARRRGGDSAPTLAFLLDPAKLDWAQATGHD